MSDINSVMLIGRLTKDVELKYISTGSAVANFSIAVNDYVKDSDNYVNFFQIEVWGKMAENCSKYLGKGSQVAIAGKLRQNRWKNEMGESRSIIKVVAKTVQFIGKKQNKELEEQVQTSEIDTPIEQPNLSEPNVSSEDPLSDEEIPF